MRSIKSELEEIHSLNMRKKVLKIIYLIISNLNSIHQLLRRDRYANS